MAVIRMRFKTPDTGEYEAGVARWQLRKLPGVTGANAPVVGPDAIITQGVPYPVPASGADITTRPTEFGWYYHVEGTTDSGWKFHTNVYVPDDNTYDLEELITLDPSSPFSSARPEPMWWSVVNQLTELYAEGVVDARDRAESAAESAQADAQAAGVAREGAEAAQTASEAAQSATEVYRDESEGYAEVASGVISRVDGLEDVADTLETALPAAVEAADTATLAAQNASESETNAAQSASDASESADSAQMSANYAGSARDEVQERLDEIIEDGFPLASDSDAGLMSAPDKVKLDGLPSDVDSAVSQFINDNSTATKKSLDSSFVGESTGIFILSKFADLSATSVTDALNTAIAQVPEWSTIVVPPNEYVTTGSVQNNGKSVRVVAEGCRFLQGVNASLVNLTGSWGTVRPISTISSVNVTTPSGNVGAMSRLTLSEPSGWQVGDVVKVFSNNVIAEGRTPSNGLAGRHGEFSTVYSVSGNTVTLSGVLMESHTQNPRVVKMNRVSAEWVGGTWRGSDEAFDNSWTSAVMNISGLYRPRISDFTIERASSMGLLVRSNYLPEITNLNVDYLFNRTDPVYQLGYGVLDASNYGLTFSNSNVNNARHAYTDDTSRIEVDDTNIGAYGRSYFANIRNVRGTGCTSSPFSPHHYGYGHTFTECVADRSIGAGFGIRGIYHHVVNCIVDRCDTGVNAFSETGGTTKGTRVVNLRSRNVSKHIAAQGVSANQHEPVLELVGGLFTGGESFLSTIEGKLVVSGSPRWIAPASLPNNSVACQINNSDLTINGSIEFDYRQNTSGTGLRMIRFGGGSLCELRADKIVVRNQGAEARMGTLISVDGSATQSDTILCPEIIVDVPTNIATSFNVERTAFNWRTSDFVQNNVCIEQFDASIVNGAFQGITRSLHYMTYVKAVANTNVGRTVGNAWPGRFPGQIVVLSWQNSNGNAVLTIPNNDSIKTGTGAGITLANDQATLLVWDGTVWRVAS